MNRILMALLVGMVFGVVFSYGQITETRDAKGKPALPFIVTVADTPKALPISGRMGIMDTLGRKTMKLYASPVGGDVRYFFGGAKPTRLKQVKDTLVTTTGSQFALDSSARGTALRVTSNGFRDSMYVKVQGTSHTDGTWLIVKKYTNIILINKAFSPDTFATNDSLFTPACGEPLHEGEQLSIDGDWAASFRFENKDSGTVNTLNLNHGTGRGM